MLLAVMRDYRLGKLNRKNVESILEAIENFHFVFTAITSQRSSGGISTMYASHAKSLGESKTLQEKMTVLDDLKRQLRAKKPGYQEFEADFLNIRYSDIYTKQKPLVQYILRKIDESKSHGIVVDYDQMTIEHLAAQRAVGADKVPSESCAQIGNLLFMDHELNDKLANKSFLEKMKLLKSSQIKLDDQLENATVWTEFEIVQRTKYLAKLSYEKIWN